MDVNGQADAGLLLLLLVVGLLITGHAVQKPLGRLGGNGLATTATVFMDSSVGRQS